MFDGATDCHFPVRALLSFALSGGGIIELVLSGGGNKKLVLSGGGTTAMALSMELN